jgi:hypothetical protein
MHLYVDNQGEYWVGNEDGVVFLGDMLPAPGYEYGAEVWVFEEAANKYDLEVVQEAGD